jgi:hypothetical protein
VRDVKHGLVSTEVAGDTYGVVVRCTDALRAEWEVDEAATRARRDELATARHSARPVDAP